MANPHYPLEALFGRVLSPFEEFLRRTTAGGIVLLGSAISAAVGLVWLWFAADAASRGRGAPGQTTARAT